MGWVEGRGFHIFIEGGYEVEIPGGRVGGEFSIGRVPDEENEVEEELGEGGTARFEGSRVCQKAQCLRGRGGTERGE